MMAEVMDKNEAVPRQQGQREADADNRRNNQIKTTVVAAAASGDGGCIPAMAAIDGGGDGQ